MRIEKSDCNYQVTECDLKFGDQITLDGESLIPISTLDKIVTEIEENISYNKKMDYKGIMVGLLVTLNIVKKYKAESEVKE